MFHAKNCTAVKYPTAIPGSLLPSNVYLVLPGSHIVHHSPLFNCKGFTESTIMKLLNYSFSIENGSNVWSLCHYNPHDSLEDEVIWLLFISSENVKLPPTLSHNHNGPVPPNTTAQISPPYLKVSNKESGAPTPVASTRIIHYSHGRDQKLRFQIPHRVAHNTPEDTQGLIDFLCQSMMEETTNKAA